MTMRVTNLADAAELRLVEKRTEMQQLLRLLEKLDFLSVTQVEQTVAHFTNELPEIVAGNPVGESANFGEWFEELNLKQKNQVVEFYNEELLHNFGLVLTWYDNYGHWGAFRFEIAIAPIPVASR